MEFTELNLISNFDAGVNCLQNPSLFSRFFSISGIGLVSKGYSCYWKWGALILALVVTFGGVIARIKLLVVRIFRLLDSSGPPSKLLVDEFDSDEDEDDSGESVSSEEEWFQRTVSFRERQPEDEDFSVAGSSRFGDDRQRQSRGLGLRRRFSFRGDRFSWSDFACGKSVVKLWDSLGLGLGLDFEDDSTESVVSIWDLNRDQKISSFPGGKYQIPAISSSSSPSVIFSAGSNNNTFFGVYDSRIGSQTPAMYAEWLTRQGKVAGVDTGGVEKVYLRDDATGAFTEVDLRNLRSPLENRMESDEDIWWDADGVSTSEEVVVDN